MNNSHSIPWKNRFFNDKFNAKIFSRNKNPGKDPLCTCRESILSLLPSYSIAFLQKYLQILIKFFYGKFKKNPGKYPLCNVSLLKEPSLFCLISYNLLQKVLKEVERPDAWNDIPFLAVRVDGVFLYELLLRRHQLLQRTLESTLVFLLLLGELGKK